MNVVADADGSPGASRRTHYRLSDHLQLHTIEMPKFNLPLSALSTDAEKWVYYLQNGHRMTAAQVSALHMPEIEMADRELQTISQDRDLRVLYEMRRKAELDALSWQKDWVEEGKRLGLDEGKRLGLDEGKRLGLVEAIRDLCDAFGVALSAEQAAWLTSLDLPALEGVRQGLKQERAWSSWVPPPRPRPGP